MLHLNLATRPFYNERAITIGIAVGVLLTAALTTFNVAQIFSLNARNSELVAEVVAAENRAAELQKAAQSTRQALSREEVSVVQARAREANVLINRRVFSWTDLFNRFEETLPPDVRILAVAPQVDRDGRMLVAMTVIARRQEDRDLFIERLESTGAFSGVIPRADNTEEDGTLRSVIQGYYSPLARAAATEAPAPSSDSSEAGDKQAPTNVTSGNSSAGEPR